MKIAFFELESWEKDSFIKHLSDHELFFYDEPLTESFDIKELQSIEVVSVFIYSKITHKVLENLPNLKYITTRSTGYDHIDIEACKQLEIKVSNVPSYGENTVAEHTFALLLSLSRKIVTSVERTKVGDFDLTDLRSFDLKDKTIGIIGLGKIGANVARIAYGFEMRILGFDPVPSVELAKNYNIKYLDLESLLKESDIITLHLPLNEKTKYLIDEAKFKLIKIGSYIINTARGGLIKTTALVEALNNGTITGAALDVLEEESVIKEELEILSPHFPKNQLLINSANNILLHDKRVIITPHNAFNSKEALERIIKTTIDNILAFTNLNSVNLV